MALHSFNFSDGSGPFGTLIQDEDGNLYGTTFGGGANNFGTVFRVDPQGNETVLHSFTGPPTDGAFPQGTLLRDEAGNLYGTTFEGGSFGGSNCGSEGCGTVFKIDSNNNETVIYNFTGGADGSKIYAGVVADAQGNLYGTAAAGGVGPCFQGCGVVFQLTPSQNGSWTETTLHTFTGGADGGTPYGGLLRDAQGNLYGTTNIGGNASGSLCLFNGIDFCGVVFKLDSSNNETVLWNFTGGQDGDAPVFGSLVMDEHGNLYGTTEYGGDLSATNPFCFGLGCGVVFKLTP
jgi:uncharacterized repeat protein (TIGR03803 family)